MKRVLVTEPFHKDGINLLNSRDDVIVIQANNSEPETLAKLIPGTHGIAVPGRRRDGVPAAPRGHGQLAAVL